MTDYVVTAVKTFRISAPSKKAAIEIARTVTNNPEPNRDADLIDVEYLIEKETDL